MRDVLQAARANAVRPLLIFLHLLECDAQRVTKLRLAHVEHHSAHSPGGTGPERAHTMRILLEDFFKNEQGATAIEYGLIAAGISIAIITAVASVGSSLNTTFTSVSTALK
jgi:pilus assembly protein Flp/PilA